MRDNKKRLLTIDDREALDQAREYRQALMKLVHLHITTLDDKLLLTPSEQADKVVIAKARCEGARELAAMLEKSLDTPLLD